MHVFGRLRNRRTGEATRDRVARAAAMRREQSKNTQGYVTRFR